MEKQIDVILCLLMILIGFVFVEALATTNAEMLAESTFNFGWASESGYSPSVD